MFKQKDKTRVLIRNNYANALFFKQIYPHTTEFESINPMLFKVRIKKSSYSHISIVLMTHFNNAFYDSIPNKAEHSRQVYVNLYKQLFTQLSGLTDEQAEKDANTIANSTLDNAIEQYQLNKKTCTEIFYDVEIKLLSNLNLFQDHANVYKDTHTYFEFFSTVAKHLNDDLMPLEPHYLTGKDEYDIYPSTKQLEFTNPMKRTLPSSNQNKTLKQIYSQYKAACAFAINTLRVNKDNNENLYRSQMDVLKSALDKLSDQPTQSNLTNFVNYLKHSSDLFSNTKNTRIIALFEGIGCNLGNHSSQRLARNTPDTSF